MLRSEAPALSSTLDQVLEMEVARRRSRWRRISWSLLLGGGIVLLIVAVAILGPIVAPQDPLETHSIFQVDDGWEIPPFPAFTVADYPLGVDEHGRDLLSRLLHAVRPTLVMISVVAAVRLVIGATIGMAAGWSNGRLGRLLDTFISGALSIPILMVALAAIAAVGAEVGLPAFIIGLSITGWAETARMVREQTRSVKGELYIEAARAMGQSDLMIMLRHVWPQIRPMVWMLMALEISGTMMATAGLSFLGYYIGGDTWIEIADFVAKSASGKAELSQMLATSYGGIAQLAGGGLPWTMLLVGTMIFAIVLGFNLLGQGFRQQLSMQQVGRQTIFSPLTRRLKWWLEERVFYPLSTWGRDKVLKVSLLGVLILLNAGAAGLLVWRLQPKAAPAALLPVPGGHLWAAERYDPYGTRYVEVEGFSDPNILWTFRDRSGLTGGPAVAADGTVYVISRQGILYALDPEGEILWETSLGVQGAGSPALDAAGNIFAPDREGGLSSFTPNGELRWKFVPAQPGVPPAGPIVAPSGTIYYPLGNRVAAVSPEGNLLWQAEAKTPGLRTNPPRISPDGEYLFWEETAWNAADGSPAELDFGIPLEYYLVGGDGLTYLLSDQIVSAWITGAEGPEIVRTAGWDPRVSRTFEPPSDVGVTRSGVIWEFYGLFGSRNVWLDANGRVLDLVNTELGKGLVVGVTADATLYACGRIEGDFGGSFVGTGCSAQGPGSEPLWRTALPHESLLAGGALVPGRLYIAEVDGYLYAIGDGPASENVVAAAVPTPTQKPTATTPPEPPSPQGLEATLEVSELCWVRVLVDGTNVLEENLSPGTTRSFTATYELRIRLGNAGGVRLILNGEDLGTLGEPGEVAEYVFGEEPAPTALPTLAATSAPSPTLTPTPPPPMATSAPTSTAPALTKTPTPTPTPQPSLTITPAPPPLASDTPPAYEGLEATLMISDRCWIHVTADGIEVFEGLLTAGSTGTFRATQELRVRMSNAGAVRVILNGQDLGVQGEPGEMVERVWRADD